MPGFTDKTSLISSMISGNNLTWDIIIIGGGITGAGVLREAVRRGYRALLIEQNDFSWGTSSRSSKMIHGGLRYLAAGDYKLTKESVQERQKLLEEAPGLVYPISFFFSFRKGLFPGPLIMKIIMLIYDKFASKKDHRFFKNVELSKKFKNLNEKNLKGAVAYTDAMVDDSRLVLRVLQDSIDLGGYAINYTEAKELIIKNSKVVGVKIQDKASSTLLSLEAPTVINATGAWADLVRKDVCDEQKVRPLRGSHAVISASICPVSDVFTFLHPKDKRGVYVYPWENTVVLGTTDLDHNEELNLEPKISNTELNYLIDGFNSQFDKVKIDRKDIISTWAGVRPVIGSGKGKDPSKERRDHVVWNDNGLITVSGGKLTTFRLIALDTLDQAKATLPKPKDIDDHAMFKTPQKTGHHVDASNPMHSKRLLGRYGDKAAKLLRTIRNNEDQFIGESNYWLTECRWAIANEAIEHIDDLMLRRTRLGMCLPDGAKNLLPRLKILFTEERNWTDEKWNEEVVRYNQIWRDSYYIP